MSKEVKIVYGARTVGATSAIPVDGTIRIVQEYERGRVEFAILVTETTEAAFATTCAAVEADFSMPRQRLRLIFGAATHLDWDPAANSAFDAVARIEKDGSRHDTGRSRRYRVTIEVALPADLANQSGRQSSEVELARTPERTRRVRITGVYTALAANAARAQYDASVGAYAAAVLGAFGGTYELVEESARANDTDKTLVFTRTYQELIFNQRVGVLDDPAIVNHQLVITRALTAPGDYGTASVTPQRLVTFTARWACGVDATSTKDLESVWSTKVRPWIVSNLETLSDGALAITSEDFSPEFATNRMTASVTAVSIKAADVFSYVLTVEDADDLGWSIVPVWTGKPLARYVFPGPGSRTRVVTLTTLQTADDRGRPQTPVEPPDNLPEPGEEAKGGAKQAKAPKSAAAKLRRLKKSRRVVDAPRVVGLVGDQQLRLVERTLVEAYEYVEDVTPAAGGAGAAGAAVRPGAGVGAPAR